MCEADGMTVFGGLIACIGIAALLVVVTALIHDFKGGKK